MEKFRLSCMYPGILKTPYVSTSCVVTMGTSTPIHGKFAVTADANRFHLFINAPSWGSGALDRSGFGHAAHVADTTGFDYVSLIA
jgi:hypothetical protein